MSILSRKKKPKSTTQFFPLDKIRPGDNSRKYFSETKLAELANSIKDTDGVLQPVLGVLDPSGDGVELILGERRWRAARLAGLAQLEVKLVDRPPVADWMKWNLAENLQRECLGPLEKAHRVKEMLGLVDEKTGRLVWTTRSLSEELGKRVRFAAECCELLQAPENVLEVMDRGEVAPEVVALIGSLPEAMRERAAREMVFRVTGVPMTCVKAREHVAEYFRRDLRRADFDRSDADLVEGAGACSECEWNGGNRTDVPGRARESVCLNPSCFAEKCAAHARAVAVSLGNHGVTVLDGDAADKIFESHSGELKVGCGYVDVKAEPDAYLLKELGGAGGRSWEDLFESEVPLVVAFDQDSNERRLVELKLAVLAVQRSSSADILKPGADTELQTVEEKELSRMQDKAERGAADLVMMEGCSELFQHLGDGDGWGIEWVMCLIRAVCEQALQNEDILFLCRALDPDVTRSGKPWEKLEELMGRELHGPKKALAFLVLVLHARRLRLEGFGSWVSDESPMWVLCQMAQFDPAGWVKRSEKRVKRARAAAEKEHAKWVKKQEEAKRKAEEEERLLRKNGMKPVGSD